MFPATTPLECVAIDILGPLLSSKDGLRFILVVTDRFIKLSHTFRLKGINADAVAQMFLNEWLFKHCAPKQLVSDNGSQFVSLLFKQVCQILSNKKPFTTTYYSQINGQDKRFNLSLAEMLGCYVEDHPTDWPKYVRFLCYSYNTSVHQTASKTPFELVLTRSPPEFSLKHEQGRDAPSSTRE